MLARRVCFRIRLGVGVSVRVGREAASLVVVVGLMGRSGRMEYIPLFASAVGVGKSTGRMEYIPRSGARLSRVRVSV